MRNGSAPGPKGPRTQPHRRRRTALLTTAGLVAALGVGGAVLQGLDNTSGGDATSSDTGVARQDAAGQGLGDRVRDLLSEHEAGKEQAEGLAPSPDISVRQSPRSDSPMAGGDTTLPSCVREGIGRSETPLAADSSHPYRGKPSYLVVLPHSGDPQKVDAYVVDSRCATGSVLGPGKVLLERTYPRK